MLNPLPLPKWPPNRRRTKSQPPMPTGPFVRVGDSEAVRERWVAERGDMTRMMRLRHKHALRRLAAVSGAEQ